MKICDATLKLPLIGLFILLHGCVTIPAKTPTAAIEAEELAADVNFLAQPALNGRKPRTIESQIARKFITNRFRQCGLSPWPGTNGFEQPFRFGTNAIGLLPGSDPNLKNQIVLLSAHYDHLGDKHLGACDNASGVAAMLEIAENLALNPQRPRRSIAFAAFDCEEEFSIGAFAFTCSEQFQKAKVAAVVNVDMLGRDFFGVVPKSLFVIGTESYPMLREHIEADANRTDLKILPIGTTLVGPTGDHIPFETMGMPVLFFSCGFFPDYHKKSDTADKLNYQNIKTSAEIICDTVRYLADAEKIEKTTTNEPVQKHEIETLDYILKTATANQDHVKSLAGLAKTLKKLTECIHRLLDKDKLTQKDYLCLLSDVVAPTLMINDLGEKIDPNMLPCLGDIYISHRKYLIEKMRSVVCAALRSKPGLFRKMEFKEEEYDLPDDFISFTSAGDDKYALYVLLPKLEFEFKLGGFPIPRVEFNFGHIFEDMRHTHCAGSMEQITDFCMLKWREKLNNPSRVKSWQKVLSKVTGATQEQDYEQWLKQRLVEEGFSNEKQWISALTKSDNKWLAAEANEIELRMAVDNGQYDKLLPLVDKLNDTKPIFDPNDPNQCSKFAEAVGPFSDNPCFLGFCQDFNSTASHFNEWTIADDTLAKLRTLTHQKFGKDKAVWRKWIKAQMTRSAAIAKNEHRT
jgi:hypothetical protein